jgi:hypothetical protein
LKKSLEAVFSHADKHIAHIEMHDTAMPLTFPDLDGALTRVGHVHRHWALLVTGSNHELTPLPQLGWQSLFARPLIPEPN